MARSKNIAGSLDANILLRLLLNDVPAQTEAAEKLLESGKKFRVSVLVLVEVVFVLEKLYRLERRGVVENVESVIRSDKFITEREVFENSLPLYENNNNLSIIDCLLLSEARLDGTTPLYSFDKNLAKKSYGDVVIP